MTVGFMGGLCGDRTVLPKRKKKKKKGDALPGEESVAS